MKTMKTMKTTTTTKGARRAPLPPRLSFTTVLDVSLVKRLNTEAQRRGLSRAALIRMWLLAATTDAELGAPDKS